MTTKQEIKNVVKEFNCLCKDNKFKEAGELAIANKSKFIFMIKCGGSKSLSYSYKICDIFNMRPIDCNNLIYS